MSFYIYFFHLCEMLKLYKLFFGQYLHGIIFFHHYVSTFLYPYILKEYISLFFLQSDSLCILPGELTTFIFNIISDIFGFKSNLLTASFQCVLFVLCSFLSSLLLYFDQLAFFFFGLLVMYSSARMITKYILDLSFTFFLSLWVYVFLQTSLPSIGKWLNQYSTSIQQ